MSTAAFTQVDDYIDASPAPARQHLQKMRQLLRAAAPNAKEKISWQMPALEQNGNLVFYAAQKKHLGFYPGSEVITAFSHRLGEYKHSKGAVQFPYDQPLPTDLIREMIALAIVLNERTALEKGMKRQKRSAGTSADE